MLVAAGAWGRSGYWGALVTTHLLGWAMLGLACALVPHTWQVKKKAGAGRSSGWGYAWRYGSARRRLRLRRKLIGRQPVAWLACRERWQSLGLWTFALLMVSGLLVTLIGLLPSDYWLIWNWIGWLFVLMLYLWAASQSCRFFVEARRSGLLELLLATPLNERQIVAGQWHASLRLFGLPILLLLAVQLGGSTLAQSGFQRMYRRTSAMTSVTVTNKSGSVTSTTVVVGSSGRGSGNAGTNTVPAPAGFQAPSPAWETTVVVVSALASALTTVANLLALCWFGMWMGMTSRTANLATLKTLLFVQIIPGFAMLFGVNLMLGLFMAGVMFRSGSATPSVWFTWWPLLSVVVGAGLAVAKDILFIVWSRRKLYSSFREEATRGLGQPRFVAPRLMPGAAAGPPVIASPR